MINGEEQKIWVGDGSKPVDGGEAEKKDQKTMVGGYEIARYKKIEIALGPSVYEKVKANVYNDVIGDICTCDITSNVTKRSRNGSVKQACVLHPEGIERWHEKDRIRRYTELAQRKKIKLEREREEKKKKASDPRRLGAAPTASWEKLFDVSTTSMLAS